MLIKRIYWAVWKELKTWNSERIDAKQCDNRRCVSCGRGFRKEHIIEGSLGDYHRDCYYRGRPELQAQK